MTKPRKPTFRELIGQLAAAEFNAGASQSGNDAMYAEGLRAALESALRKAGLPLDAEAPQ